MMELDDGKSRNYQPRFMFGLVPAPVKGIAVIQTKPNTSWGFIYGGEVNTQLSKAIDLLTWAIETARYEYTKSILRSYLKLYERMIP